MLCPLESKYGGMLGADAQNTFSVFGPTPACPQECTGPVIETEPRPILFGKWGPAINRTVQVCPITGNQYPRTFTEDLLIPLS
jgi:hypothetical protein